MALDLECEWSHGQFTVTRAAGMLVGASFVLGDRAFEPFARSDWRGSPSAADVSEHLQVLGGEFVGVPFGSAGPPDGMPACWRDVVGTKCNDLGHGLSANSKWEVANRGEGAVTLSLDYGEDSPVARLERHISGVPGKPALQFSLTIFARRRARVSVGLHPILKLPEEPRSLELATDFSFGLTYPGRLPQDNMVTAPASRFSTLRYVPAQSGTVDLSRLPLGRCVEDNVQLCGVRSPVTAIYHQDKAGIVLDWDRRQLPSVMLWLSDRGIDAPPFNRGYRGLGIEPIAAAFDLADAISIGNNPINAQGVKTWLEIAPDRAVTLHYSFTAFALGEVVGSKREAERRT